MSKGETVLKAVLSSSALPGAFMTLMGVGLLPVDKTMAAMAGAFVDPLGIPVRPFWCVLGPLKVLGGLALWGIGPLPQWFARGGLTFAAACGSYAHVAVGESPMPPLIYIGLMGALCLLESTSGKGKTE